MKKTLLAALVATAFLIRGGAGETVSPAAGSGRFTALTYNVAGLPEGISQSHPLWFQKRISPLLNDFDLVIVQEDFFYHHDLSSQVTLPYASPPGTDGLLGDGLARFSRFPLGKVDHIAWQTCHGTLGYANDCLTPKGFSYGVLELKPRITIDVYNLHLDAGGSQGDQEARARQMDQLLAFMESHSAGQPIIIGGDWNLSAKRERDLETLDRILDEQDLIDSCRALSCPQDRIDRILFRSNDQVRLTPVAYKVEIERFKNPWGGQLSDHEAVSVVFEWELLE